METQAIETYLQRAISTPSHSTFDGDIDYVAPPMKPKAEAAVLILINTGDTPKLILTQRQSHMRKHGGQVAFPGGRKDEDDNDHWATALREANEEIGLPLDHPITRIGQLDPHETITGFTVIPCIALTEAHFTFRPQPTEVQQIFEIPLSRIHPDNFRIEGKDYGGTTRHYYVLPHDDFFIWGATARMLQNLGQRLSHVRYF